VLHVSVQVLLRPDEGVFWGMPPFRYGFPFWRKRTAPIETPADSDPLEGIGGVPGSASLRIPWLPVLGFLGALEYAAVFLLGVRVSMCWRRAIPQESQPSFVLVPHGNPNRLSCGFWQGPSWV